MTNATPGDSIYNAELFNTTLDKTDDMANITEAVPTLTEMNDAEIARLVPTLVYLGIISMTGIFGNGLACHIYRTRYRLSNSQCFILCLSAIDLFSCCVVIPLEFTTVINQYTFQHFWLCKFSRFFNTLSSLSSAFLLFFIAIDRYRKICKPFSRQISAKVAKFLSVLAVILGLVFSWPAVLVYGKKTFSIPEYGLIGTECSTDDSMVDTIYPFVNISVYGVLFVSEIISIIVIYCLIGREVQHHVNRMPKEHKHMSKSVHMSTNSEKEVNEEENLSTNSEKEVTKNECLSTDSDDSGIKTDKNLTPEDDKQFELITKDIDDPKKDIADTRQTKNTQNKANPDFEKDNDIHTTNSISPVSSERSLIKQRKSVGERLLSIASQICGVLSRMTSVVNKHSVSSTNTFGKTQFLKQARARKTAFLMFLISLAFVLSYLPHLLLMLTRALKDDFIDNMSDTERAVYKFFLRSYFLNCAINPVIYAACASRFRTECKALFNRMCGRAETEDNNS